MGQLQGTLKHVGLKYVTPVQITCPKHGVHTVLKAELPDGTWYTGRCQECQAESPFDNTIQYDAKAVERRRVDNAVVEALPPLYRTKTLKSFRLVDQRTMDAAYACSRIVSGDLANLVLIGETECGKSHLLAGTVIAAIEEGLTARYVTEADLLGEIKEAFNTNGSDRRVLSMFASYDVLAIDEIGCTKSTQYNLQTLAELVDKRRLNIKRTVYAGNLTVEGLRDYLTDPMLKRVKDNGQIMVLQKADWRSA
jgi:DNA replication protein DnaC